MHRYSHVFSVVSSCHAADSCLDWTWWNDSLATTIAWSQLSAISSQILRITSSSLVANASVIRARSTSYLAGRGREKNLVFNVSPHRTLSLTYPYIENSRGVKSGDRGGQAIVPPRPIKATICRVTRGNRIELLLNICRYNWNIWAWGSVVVKALRY